MKHELMEVKVNDLSDDALTWAVAKVLNFPIDILTTEELHDRLRKSDPLILDEHLKSLFSAPELCFLEKDGYKKRFPVLINGMARSINFTSDWNQVGPLISEQDIDFDTNRARAAHCVSRAVMDAKYKVNGFNKSRIDAYGSNIFEASMRCLVKSYVGEKIQVPSILCAKAGLQKTNRPKR